MITFSLRNSYNQICLTWKDIPGIQLQLGMPTLESEHLPKILSLPHTSPVNLGQLLLGVSVSSSVEQRK